MKLLGALLLLGGTGGWLLQRRREKQLPLHLGRALLEDLAILRYQIQVCRTPLPELLSELAAGISGEAVWKPLAVLLSQEGAYLPRCWRETLQDLPLSLRRILSPIGPLLPAGGEPLAEAIEEAREELTRFLHEEAVRQASRNRVTAAVCLAGASLVILVLL